MQCLARVKKWDTGAAAAGGNPDCESVPMPLPSAPEEAAEAESEAEADFPDGDEAPLPEGTELVVSVGSGEIVPIDCSVFKGWKTSYKKLAPENEPMEIASARLL